MVKILLFACKNLTKRTKDIKNRFDNSKVTNIKAYATIL